jgi:DNA recombination protein RmuC
MGPGLAGVIGLLFGSMIAWLALRARTAGLRAHLSLMEKELAAGKADLARLQQAQSEFIAHKARLESALDAERKANNEKVELVTRASEELRNAFKAMAADALKSNFEAISKRGEGRSGKPPEGRCRTCFAGA